MATDITINDLTTATDVNDGASNGTGVFDKLMDAVNRYLIDDYTAGRTVGTDYATVKAAAYTAVLQQSVQFLLNEQQATAQTALIEQQTLTEFQQTAKLSYEVANLLPEQLLKMQEEIKVMSQKIVGRKQSAVTSE